MRHCLLLTLLFSLQTCLVYGQLPLRHEEGYSLTYDESTEAWRQLADRLDDARLVDIGPSDIGRPIYAFCLGAPDNGRPTIMVNNGIHPGESCGVDASIKWVDELIAEESDVLSKVNLVIITLYNVGGSHHRGCCSRANQNGPTEQGFRGNARYLDLNRDFIKMDSRNAEAFVGLFREWRPHLFVDTHTSNGADYRHTMTLIHSQLDMIAPELRQAYESTLLPHLYSRMESTYPMIPYMNLKGRTPEEGITAFPDWPRYSTGYTGLFNCFGFTTEAHMLKPFSDRVKATADFLSILGQWTAQNRMVVLRAKQMADRADRQRLEMALDYTEDTLRVDTVVINGYTADYKKSEVSGEPRLWYDHKRPIRIKVPKWDHRSPTDMVDLPAYYVLPQAWREVVHRLEMNGVEMSRLDRDSLLSVTTYRIQDFETTDRPYEGHYLHSEVETVSEKEKRAFYQGDYLISTDQEAVRFLVNTLEPRAHDSYFAWNAFDAVLQQKEWFSDYVFEDVAAEMLRTDPDLKAELEAAKVADRDLADSGWAQLYFIYQRSPYFETGHRLYPVFRVER